MPPTDNQLTQLARAVARRFRRCSLDPDDLRQEAYLAMLTAFRRGETRDGVLVNIARDRLRTLCEQERRTRAESLPEVSFTYEDAESQNLPDADQGPRPPHRPTVVDRALADRGLGPVAEVEINELLEIIWERLPVRQAGAIVFKCWHGMDNPEIARQLNCTVEAVEQLLARGQKQLRQILGSENGGE